MTKREVAMLTTRVVSAYMLFEAFDRIDVVSAGLMNLFQDFGENRSPLLRFMVLIASFLPFSLFTGAGAFLWIQAPLVARLMLRGLDDPPAHPDEKAFSVSLVTMEQAACTILGILLLTQAIPRFAYSVCTIILADGTPIQNIFDTVQNRSQLAASSAGLIFAIILIASGRTVLRLIGRMRHIIHHGKR